MTFLCDLGTENQQHATEEKNIKFRGTISRRIHIRQLKIEAQGCPLPCYGAWPYRRQSLRVPITADRLAVRPYLLGRLLLHPSLLLLTYYYYSI